jgi:N-acetylglutamate synthase
MIEADLPAARQLWDDAAGVELAEGDSLEELRYYLWRNPGMSFVATVEDRVVGAVLAGHDGRRGFLYHLAVSREQQGARIGRTLVAHSLAALKAERVARVLILVSRDNELGQKFWSQQGWEPLTFAQPMGIDL